MRRRFLAGKRLPETGTHPMTETFNQDTLINYEKLLGKKELYKLWLVFDKEGEGFVIRAQAALKNHDYPSLRAVYHQIRPAAEVFGLDSFALLCAKIEHNIVNRDLAEIDQEVCESISLCKKGLSSLALYMDSAHAAK